MSQHLHEFTSEDSSSSAGESPCTPPNKQTSGTLIEAPSPHKHPINTNPYEIPTLRKKENASKGSSLVAPCWDVCVNTAQKHPAESLRPVFSNPSLVSTSSPPGTAVQKHPADSLRPPYPIPIWYRPLLPMTRMSKNPLHDPYDPM